MGALFSPDSKLMQAMGRLGDLVVLNLLFLCTCLPTVSYTHLTLPTKA